MGGIVWQVESPLWQQVVWGLFGLGGFGLFSSFLTDHVDLSGLRQTWLYFVKKSYNPVKFTEQLLYRWIRHPMMLGILIAFWATPVMTVGHFVFSVGMSFYVMVGIYFEERGLAESIGSKHVEYQQRTSRVIPIFFKKNGN
jgi:steroid 5-alpha reductase family enzyme